jgi:hypothetical protein
VRDPVTGISEEAARLSDIQQGAYFRDVLRGAQAVSRSRGWDAQET